MAKTTKPAVKRTVEDIDPQYLDCRDLGHSWRHHEAVENKRFRQWQRTVRCAVCTTLRHQVLDFRGYRVRAWYEYPKGYLVRGAEFTVDDRARLRILNIRRAIEATAQA